MSGRIEYKYLAPYRLMARIRADIQPFVSVDRPPIAAATAEYTVRSVYYDTPHFDCYNEKLAGTSLRRKFRVRGYGAHAGDSRLFLEIKRKREAFIKKHRAPLHHEHVEAFLASGDIDRYLTEQSQSDRERHDARRFMFHYYRRALRPAVLVVYDREAFMGKLDPSLRITFDKNLRCSRSPSIQDLYDESCLRSAMPQHFMLEVKFFRNALPAWVRSLIQRYELPRLALSKYVICMDCCDEDGGIPILSRVLTRASA